MFNFFKKKPPAPTPSEPREDAARADDAPAPAAVPADAESSGPAAPDLSATVGSRAADVAAGPVAADAGADEGTALAEPEPAQVAPPATPPGAAAANAVARGAALPPIVPAAAETPPADIAAGTPPANSAAEPARADAPAEPVSEKGSWLTRLRSGLSRTGKNLSTLFVGVKVDENLFEELETALIMADAGTEATEKLLTALRARVRKDKIEDGLQVKAALRDVLAEHLKPLEREFDVKRASPLVVMIAGVNGAGKTTSIGKLAHAFQAQGASVLLAAGDTFRAAAREQLIEWGARNNVSVISQEGGDPAAVSFDAVNAGRARGMGVVMVDTAGRLPTQLHLMEELKKVRRVIAKADPSAPHEVLLVIDGNTGQNALAQIRAFDAAINLTGLVVTKLDGTAKGGTLAAVAAGSQGVRPVPVYWIGVGEGMNDLQPFVAKDFAAALLAD